MLDPIDDYLIHQTSYPVRFAGTTDPRFFDRFYMNVHDMSGEFCVILGLGVYPNNNTMDAFVCGVQTGSSLQHNARFFRHLDGPRTETAVGPIRFDVLDPMKRWNVILEPNPYGLELDLELEGRWAPWECGHVRSTHLGGTKMDMHHYVQSNRYTGRVVLGELERGGTFLGMRDRSWGVREIGGVPAPGGSKAYGMWGMHLWLTAQYEDCCYFVFYDEDQNGEPIFLEGGIMGGPCHGRSWSRLEHDWELMPGTRVHANGVLLLTDSEGLTHELRTERLADGIYLAGAGYGSTQGVHRGDHSEGEVWDLDRDGASIAGFAAEGDQPVRLSRSDGAVGYGVFEHMVASRHPRYGRRRAPSRSQRLTGA
jgi:hypothetical protein